MLHKGNQQRGVDTRGDKIDNSDKENLVPFTEEEKKRGEAGDAGRGTEPQCYRYADPCRSSWIPDDVDIDQLRLRIEEWQGTFPEELPAPEEFASYRDEAANTSSTGGHRWRSSDYIVPLTVEELAGVPKYARGRMAFAEINRLVGSFNDILEAKYRLLSLPASKVASWQYVKFAAYRQQETAETVHRRFLTEGDLVGKASLFDSRRKVASFFVLMRHCGRIQEIRGPGKISRYAVK